MLMVENNTDLIVCAQNCLLYRFELKHINYIEMYNCSRSSN